MPVYLGTTNITNVRVGTAAATKVYVGSTQAWSAAAPPAFPAVASTNTQFGTSLVVITGLAAPSGTTAGDLLIGFCSHDAAGLVSEGNWTMIGRATATATVHQLAIFARIATATALDEFHPTSIAGQDYCASVLRITGHGVIDPATDIKVAGTVATVNGTTDSPNLNTGVSTSWLWLSAAAVDGTTGTTLSAVPSGYTQAHAPLTSAALTSSLLGVAYRTNAASSEDPGPWTNTARVWLAATLGIPPVGIGATLPNFYIAGSSVLQTSGSGDRIIQPDLGTQIGDLVVVVNSLGTDTFACNPPAGWTTIKASTITGTLASGCFARLRAAGDSSYAYTVTGSINSSHLCLNLRGMGSTISGADGTRAASGGTTAVTAPQVTTTFANSMVMCIATERTTATETGITSVTNSMTEYIFVPHGGGGTETIWVGTKMIPFISDSGPTTVTYPNAHATNAYAFHLATRPA